MKTSTLVYPDLNKLYTLFVDALKYAWSAVLNQEHATITDEKTLISSTSYHLY